MDKLTLFSIELRDTIGDQCFSDALFAPPSGYIREILNSMHNRFIIAQQYSNALHFSFESNLAIAPIVSDVIVTNCLHSLKYL